MPTDKPRFKVSFEFTDTRAGTISMTYALMKIGRKYNAPITKREVKNLLSVDFPPRFDKLKKLKLERLNAD